MAKITLVKTPAGSLVGLTHADRKQQAQLKAMKAVMEPGELLSIEYKHPRNYRFHKKFFALLNLGFEAWEPEKNRKRLKYNGMEIEKNYDKFREMVIIRAGFYKQFFDLNGRMQLEAESISFGSMDEARFQQVYEAVQMVLLHDVLTNYTKDDLDRVVEELMRFTERNG